MTADAGRGPAAVSDEGFGPQVERVLRAVARRWASITATVILTVLAVVSLSTLLPTSYSATSELLLEARPSEQPAGPNGGVQPRSTSPQVEAQVVTSRIVEDAVIRSIGKDRWGRAHVKALPGTDNPTMTVTATAPSAREAVTAVTSVVDAYLKVRRDQVAADLEAAYKEVTARSAAVARELTARAANGGATLSAQQIRQLQAAAPLGDAAFSDTLGTLGLASATGNGTAQLDLVGLLLRKASYDRRADDLQVALALIDDSGPRVITPARTALRSGPTKLQTAALALLTGLFLAAFVAWLRERRDDTVPRPILGERAPTAVGTLPVLASLRRGEEPGARALKVRELVRSLELDEARSGVLVVGAEHAVSRTAAELAGAHGAAGIVVRSDVTGAFSSATQPALLEPESGEDAFATLTPARVAPVVARLTNEHGAVMIVAPPLTKAPDAALLAGSVGTVALVGEYGRTSLPDLEETAVRLRRAGGSVAGVVLRDPESSVRRAPRT